MAKIGDLETRLRLEGRQFARGLKRADESVGRFVSSLGGLSGALGKLGPALAAVGVSAGFGVLAQRISAAAKESASWGATLVEASGLIGITTTQLDLMRRAFEANGVSVAEADQSLLRFNRRLEFARKQAVKGAGEYAESFADLGLDARQFASTEEAFRSVFQRLSGISDTARRGAIAFRLFGDSASSLDATFRAGISAFDQEIARQREIGVLASGNAATLKELDQTFTDLKNTLGVSTRNAIAESADEIEILVDLFTKLGTAAIRAGAQLSQILTGPAGGPPPAVAQLKELTESARDLGRQDLVDRIERIRIDAGRFGYDKLADDIKAVETQINLLSLSTKDLDTGFGKAAQTLSDTARAVLAGVSFDATEFAKSLSDARTENEALAALLADPEALEAYVAQKAALGDLQLQTASYSAELERLIKVRQRLDRPEAVPVPSVTIVPPEFDYRKAKADGALLAEAYGAALVEGYREVGDKALTTTFDEMGERLATSLVRAGESFVPLEDVAVSTARTTQYAWEQVSLTFSGILSRVDSWKDALIEIAGLASQVLAHFAGGGTLRSFFGFEDIPGRRRGGPTQAGKPYIVGEEGPELFVPRSSGTVIPANAQSQVAAAGINVQNLTIQGVTDPQVVYAGVRNLLREDWRRDINAVLSRQA